MVRFRPLISALCQQNVDFVLIGGIAAVAQGSAYLTWDMDICYSRVAPNLDRLVKALQPFEPHLRGAPSSLPFVLDVPTLKAGCNFTLTTNAGNCDLLGEVAGLGDYQHVLEHAITMEIADFPCRVLSIEGLILAKKASSRPKDTALLTELEALQALRKKQE